MTTKKILWFKKSGPFSIEGKEFEYSRYTPGKGSITVCLKSDEFPEYRGEIKKQKKGDKEVFIPNGYGRLTIRIRDSNFNVYGDWENGNLSLGEIKVNDQLFYKGELKSFKQHGRGIMYFQNGTEWKHGLWKNGKIIDGVENYPNGKRKYEGYFQNDKLNGHGKFYQQDGNTIKQEGIFENGILKISKQSLQKIKSQQTIKKFMDTNKRQYLTQITKQEIKDYLKKHAKTKVDGTKQQLIQHLDMFRKQLLQQKQTNPKQDLITGQQIKNPVIADDGIIYDKSTLSRLFQKKQNGDYKNIPYIYNQKYELVPNYRRLAGGKPVTTFYTLKQLRDNPSIPNHKQLLQKLQAFS